MSSFQPVDPSPAPSRGDELLRRAQQGDRAAFCELVRPHLVRLHLHVRELMSEELARVVQAEDLVQAVLSRMFGRLALLRSVRALPKVLRTEATRCVIDEARFHGRECRDPGRCVSLDAPDTVGGAVCEPLAPSGTPSSVVSRAEQQRVLRELIDTLPGEWRDVIVLHAFERLEWDEIGRRMGGRTPRAASALYRRAMQRLGELLGPG